MANNIDELKALRNLVRKTRSAVTAKENRIKRQTGIDIRDTPQDPRRPINVVDTYNRRQLNSYLADLKAFMSRNSGFLYGANKTLISSARWLEYKKLENKYNAIGAKQFEGIADIFIPQAGMTIRQRDNIKPDAIFAQGDIVQRPYSVIDRQPNNIASEEALNKLIASMKKKVAPGYLNQQLKAGREQLNQMLTVIGNADLVGMAKKLSNVQFDILWNHTSFATNVSGTYFIIQKKIAGTEDKWYSSVVEDHNRDIREILSWAASITEDGIPVQNGDTRVVNFGQKKKSGKR